MLCILLPSSRNVALVAARPGLASQDQDQAEIQLTGFSAHLASWCGETDGDLV